MKYILFILIFSTVFISCSNPEARKPIVRKTSSFMNESIERNKLLNKAENAILMQKIKSDSLHKYMSSEYGFWYYYDVKVPADSYIAKSGDAVF